ncbi:hypothetical protein BDW69DRAFT_63730 [Aspergillus filifer]
MQPTVPNCRVGYGAVSLASALSYDGVLRMMYAGAVVVAREQILKDVTNDLLTTIRSLDGNLTRQPHGIQSSTNRYLAATAALASSMVMILGKIQSDRYRMRAANVVSASAGALVVLEAFGDGFAFGRIHAPAPLCPRITPHSYRSDAKTRVMDHMETVYHVLRGYTDTLFLLLPSVRQFICLAQSQMIIGRTSGDSSRLYHA